MKALVVAGEASADIHAALIFKKLREHIPVDIIGIGGQHLQELGLKPIATPEQMGVVGLIEALGKIPQALRLIRELDQLAATEKPDCAFLCDLPDFNLRLAPKLKERGIPVFYYVAPQVWAWRQGRLPKMQANIDMLFSIFPFEHSWLQDRSGINVKYVGHPAIEEIPAVAYEPIDSQVAVLPGSRVSEVTRVLPVLAEALFRLKQATPSLRFVIPVAPTLRSRKTEVFQPLVDKLAESVDFVDAPAYEVLRHAKVAIVTSGTATLETAIIGCPMVVVYKVNPLSAFIFRNFVSYTGPIAMANLIHVGFSATDRVVPELIQENCTPDKIFQEVNGILQNATNWQRQREVLAGTRDKLSTNTVPHSDMVVSELLEWQKNASVTS